MFLERLLHLHLILPRVEHSDVEHEQLLLSLPEHPGPCGETKIGSHCYQLDLHLITSTKVLAG